MDKLTKYMLIALIFMSLVLAAIYTPMLLNKINPDYITRIEIVTYADHEQKIKIDSDYYYLIGPEKRRLNWVR